MFGALVILEADCKCLILELVRQTLAQSLTGAGVVREAQVTSNLGIMIIWRDRDTSGITYHVLQESLAGLFAQLDHHLSENHCNVRESRTNKIEDYISVVLSVSNLSYVWQM